MIEIKNLYAKVVDTDIEILKGQKRDIEKNTSDIRYNMKAFRSELLKIKDTPDDTQFEHLKNLIKDFERMNPSTSSGQAG